MGIGNQFVTAVSQSDRVIDTLEQKTAKLRFQLLDLKGYGRLGISQLFRSIKFIDVK